MNRRDFLQRSLLLAAGSTLGACASSQPTHFYLLPTLGEDTTALGLLGGTLGLAPLQLPDYLNRPQILERSADGALRLDDFELWGEPLKAGIARALRENLARLLPQLQVVMAPWRRAAAPSRVLWLQVLRCESEGTTALFALRWQLQDADGRELLAPRHGEYRETLEAADTAAVVGALGRALARFSRDLATQLTRAAV